MTTSDMTAREDLDLIYQIRGKVLSNDDLTGENLFLVWGYPTVIVLLMKTGVPGSGQAYR